MERDDTSEESDHKNIIEKFDAITSTQGKQAELRCSPPNIGAGFVSLIERELGISPGADKKKVHCNNYNKLKGNLAFTQRLLAAMGTSLGEIIANKYDPQKKKYQCSFK